MATERRNQRVVKVAIVGTGLAALTSAYLLTSGNSTGQKKEDRVDNDESVVEGSGSEDDEVFFDVHVFEKVSELPPNRCFCWGG